MYESYDRSNYPFLGSPASIPRCHYYPASEGSDEGSTSGGGSFGSIFQSNHQHSEDQGLNHERSQEDTTFIPSDYAIPGVQSPAGRGLARPSEHHRLNTLVRAVGNLSPSFADADHRESTAPLPVSVATSSILVATLDSTRITRTPTTKARTNHLAPGMATFNTSLDRCPPPHNLGQHATTNSSSTNTKGQRRRCLPLQGRLVPPA